MPQKPVIKSKTVKRELTKLEEFCMELVNLVFPWLIDLGFSDRSP
jgi:hypothetical protein